MNRTQRGGGGTKNEKIDGKIGGPKFTHLDFPSNRFDMFERAGGGGIVESDNRYRIYLWTVPYYSLAN